MGFEVLTYTITDRKRQINIITKENCNVSVGQVFTSKDTSNNKFTVLWSLGLRQIQLSSAFPISGVNIGTKFEEK